MYENLPGRVGGRRWGYDSLRASHKFSCGTDQPMLQSSGESGDGQKDLLSSIDQLEGVSSQYNGLTRHGAERRSLRTSKINSKLEGDLTSVKMQAQVASLNTSAENDVDSGLCFSITGSNKVSSNGCRNDSLSLSSTRSSVSSMRGLLDNQNQMQSPGGTESVRPLSQNSQGNGKQDAFNFWKGLQQNYNCNSSPSKPQYQCQTPPKVSQFSVGTATRPYDLKLSGSELCSFEDSFSRSNSRNGSSVGGEFERIGSPNPSISNEFANDGQLR